MKIRMPLLGLSLGLGLASCVPLGTSEDTDTDTDTDTDGATESSPATTMTASATSATTESSTGATPSGQPSATSPTSAPTTETSTTGDSEDDTSSCAPGSEDCPCDIGSSCDGDLICVEGTCVGERPCDQPEGEPNDGFDAAVELGEIACTEDFETSNAAAAGLDADFYTFTEGPAPVIPCFGPDPQARAEADVDLRVCVYVECAEEGDSSATCSGFGGGGEDQTEDELDGLPGCCGENAARTFGYNCPGFAPGPPTFYARVTSTEEDACVPYELGVTVN